jgi:hypothetical protein
MSEAQQTKHMSDEKKVKIETEITIVAGEFVTIGGVSHPAACYRTPAHTRKTKSGDVAVAEKEVYGLAPFTAKQGLAFLSAAVAEAEKVNVGGGDTLINRVLSDWSKASRDGGMVTRPDGSTQWDGDAAAKTLVTPQSRRTGVSEDDVRASLHIILMQLLAVSDINQEYLEATREVPLNDDGTLSFDPWDGEKWDAQTARLNTTPGLELNVNIDSYSALSMLILNKRDQRKALESQIAVLEAKRAEAAEKRNKKKLEQAAAAPAPATPIEPNVQH